MNNEYYGAPTTPTSDYLAHYGIKGMKWGVRRARAIAGMKGTKALGKQYKKAQKKLERLEKRALSGKKYAKRAAALGAGAAAAGGLAALGTSGVSNLLGRGSTAVKRGQKALGSGIHAVGMGLGKAANLIPGNQKHMSQLGLNMARAGTNMQKTSSHAGKGLWEAGRAVNQWGKGDSVGKAIGGAVQGAGIKTNQALKKITGKGGDYLHGAHTNLANAARGASNNTIARIGAAAVGAGLAAGAGYNAYRAATTKRAARKAAQFRSEMNKAFAGTQYANGGAPKRKRRR